MSPTKPARTRRLVALTVTLLVLGPTHSMAVADETPPPELDGVNSDREGNVSAEVSAPPVSADAGSLEASAAGTTLYWVAIPVWSMSGDPTVNEGYCTGIHYVAGESPEEAEALRIEGEEAFWALHADLLANEAPGISPNVDCPNDPADLIPGPVLRDAVRGAVVDHLPRPVLEIPPGWALTGMPAYLVTNHELTYGPAVHTIDLGLFPVTVEIVAHGTTTVDWGDGTVTTHHGPGEPWPDGQIHHTYRDAGIVTVTVIDRWVVNFTVTDPVTIDDSLVATLGARTIDDLEVRQIQSVRTTSSP